MKKLLDIAGVTVLSMVNKNIREGIDYEGNKLHYSEKPFYRPYNQRLWSQLKKSPGLADIVTTKEGKLGFIIHGYKAYKQFMNPEAFGNFLTWRGTMLRSMRVLKTSETEAVIGFGSSKEAEKAFWFNVSGVGRSRKLWKFLGITNTQKQELTQNLSQEFYKITVEELGKVIAEINSKRN